MARTLRPTNNDRHERTRRATIDLLNRQLADIVELQAKQSHCTVQGPHFIGLQELFDTLADELFDTVVEELEESTDGIAERA